MFWSILLSTIGVYILYIIYSAYWKTYKLQQFYSKQGIDCKLDFGFHFFEQFEEDVKKHGDAVYYFKKYSANLQKHPAFAGNYFSKVFVLLTDTKAIHSFSNNHELFIKDPDIFKIFLMELGSGLLFSEGKTWKKHRKLTSQAFHFEFIKNNLPVVVKVANSVFDRIEKSGGKGVDIIQEFQAITGESVGQLFFGKAFGTRKVLNNQSATQLYADFVFTVSQICLSPMFQLAGAWPFKLGLTERGRRYNELRHSATAFANEILKEKEEEFNSKGSDSSSKGKDLIDLFLQQRKDQPDDCYSNKEMLYEFLTFFIAGMDTTGHLLTMASYYLLKNPECMKKVMAEVNQHIKSDDDLNTENLGKMNYLSAVIKETLRVATPAPTLFDRTACEDVTIGDLKIKKGTNVSIALATLNFSPEYHDEPEKFDPERWLNPDSKTNQTTSKNPYVFTPFSAGGRNCIGQHLAMMETKIILSMFLKRFDYEMADKDYQLQMQLVFLYEPHVPIKYDLMKK